MGRQACPGCDERSTSGQWCRIDPGAPPEGLQLIEELALGSRVVHPTETKPQLLVGGHLHAMPTSLLGVPTDVPNWPVCYQLKVGGRRPQSQNGPRPHLITT